MFFGTMPLMRKFFVTFKQKPGSVLIDALMGVTLFSFYFTIVISVLLLTQQSQKLSSQRYEALLEANSMLEALISISDSDFNNILVIIK